MLSSSRMATAAGLVILALLAATPIYAQNVGTVRGTVTSPDGEPLPGVLVQVTGEIVRGERTSINRNHWGVLDPRSAARAGDGDRDA